MVTVDGLEQNGEFKKAQDEVIADLKDLFVVHHVNITTAIEGFCLQ